MHNYFEYAFDLSSFHCFVSEWLSIYYDDDDDANLHLETLALFMNLRTTEERIDVPRTRFTPKGIKLCKHNAVHWTWSMLLVFRLQPLCECVCVCSDADMAVAAHFWHWCSFLLLLFHSILVAWMLNNNMTITITIPTTIATIVTSTLYRILRIRFLK